MKFTCFSVDVSTFLQEIPLKFHGISSLAPRGGAARGPAEAVLLAVAPLALVAAAVGPAEDPVAVLRKLDASLI